MTPFAYAAARSAEAAIAHVARRSGAEFIAGGTDMLQLLQEGVRAHCIAAYPGDLAVALVALDAWVEVAGPEGTRNIPLTELHRLPGDTPHIETALQTGELITTLVIPTSALARRSHYLKVRDRT